MLFLRTHSRTAKNQPFILSVSFLVDNMEHRTVPPRERKIKNVRSRLYEYYSPSGVGLSLSGASPCFMKIRLGHQFVRPTTLLVPRTDLPVPTSLRRLGCFDQSRRHRTPETMFHALVRDRDSAPDSILGKGPGSSFCWIQYVPCFRPRFECQYHIFYARFDCVVCTKL